MLFVHRLKECELPEVRSLLRKDAVVGVTIGNFDGMHLGHQALFAELSSGLSKLAEERGGTPVKVRLTFAPHPREVLQRIRRRSDPTAPLREFPQLTPLRCKAGLARQFGFDLLFAVKFTSKIAALDPVRFVEEYLVGGLRASLVVVGFDWSFGRGRSGTTETLAELGGKHGFIVRVVPPVEQNGRRYSSSLVRDALARGALPELRDYLGRNFETSGYVVGGDRRGRTLGIPTANIRPHNQLLPPDGVYVTTARFDDSEIPAVTNVGVRPSFGGGERLIETHLLPAGSYNLYGKYLRVELLHRLRDELTFHNVDELVAQMHQDIADAKRFHAAAGHLRSIP